MTTPFIDHILAPVLPEQLPARFALRGHTATVPGRSVIVDDAYFEPGLEGSVVLAGTDEAAFYVHAIVDRDYRGQWMYVQIARRADDTTAFGCWHYGFYYRGGDSTWEHWTLDLVHGTTPPPYATFGAYVDEHTSEQRRQFSPAVESFLDGVMPTITERNP